MKSLTKFLFLIIIFCSFNLTAFNAIKKTQFEGFKNEGAFVEYPTYAGSAAGCIIMGYPAAVATEPLRLILPNSLWCDRIGYYMVAWTSKGLGAAFGVFPYILKKIFYDAPAHIAGNKGQKQEVAKVKPFKLPQELMTPIIAHDRGDVKNIAEDDIFENESIILYNEEQSKKVKYFEEEKTPEEIKSVKEEEKPVQKISSEKKKETKKQPVKVSPDLPSWLKQEIKSNESK